MFETILVPTDGSEHARAAATDAIALADEHGASLHVLSVADSGPLGGIRLPGEAGSPDDVLGNRAQRFVDEIVDRGAAAGVDAIGRVEHGPPPSTILEYARDIDADLIVMGSRGQGGLHRMAVGSVADHVIRFGGRRVLIVDTDEDDEER